MLHVDTRLCMSKCKYPRNLFGLSFKDLLCCWRWKRGTTETGSAKQARCFHWTQPCFLGKGKRVAMHNCYMVPEPRQSLLISKCVEKTILSHDINSFSDDD